MFDYGSERSVPPFCSRSAEDSSVDARTCVTAGPGLAGYARAGEMRTGNVSTVVQAGCAEIRRMTAVYRSTREGEEVEWVECKQKQWDVTS